MKKQLILLFAMLLGTSLTTIATVPDTFPGQNPALQKAFLIDTAQLGKGIYLLSLESQSGIKTIKLIKQ